MTTHPQQRVWSFKHQMNPPKRDPIGQGPQRQHAKRNRAKRKHERWPCTATVATRTAHPLRLPEMKTGEMSPPRNDNPPTKRRPPMTTRQTKTRDDATTRMNHTPTMGGVWFYRRPTAEPPDEPHPLRRVCGNLKTTTRRENGNPPAKQNPQEQKPQKRTTHPNNDVCKTQRPTAVQPSTTHPLWWDPNRSARNDDPPQQQPARPNGPPNGEGHAPVPHTRLGGDTKGADLSRSAQNDDPPRQQPARPNDPLNGEGHAPGTTHPPKRTVPHPSGCGEFLNK
ncbi:hypothetical protein BS47DRAFT_1453914 [Hydnum rufescens UP504]|uniref:Uncharacterized protein n=1 Tax=Hydnum rufescens UP504 TaxID=1448309 RepID=A0A9P6AY73_9AGAM|nr:hypothetical protein BS47DRAFT_1453914 [Hydnum rufescens UP504]